MEFITPLRPEPAASLALALIASSQVPLLVLDDRFMVVCASASFCRVFAISPDAIEGLGLANIGNGEWDVPQLHSLLRATLASNATSASTRAQEPHPACRASDASRSAIPTSAVGPAR